jgi:hypothetical protein
MGAKYNFPATMGNDVLKIINDLNERLKKLERSQRTIATEGGEDTDGGSSTVWYGADGVTKILEIGTLPNGDRGLIAYRSNGSEVLRIANLAPGDPIPVFQISDTNGNVLLQDDWANGNGLNWPKLVPGVFVPITSASQVTTTSTSFVDMFKGLMHKHNQGFHVAIEVNTTGPTVQAQMQLWDETVGALSGTVVTHTAGTTVTRYDLGPSGTYASQDYGTDREYRIQGRISSGTGTLTARVLRVMGE